jgi:hypothetical protein
LVNEYKKNLRIVDVSSEWRTFANSEKEGVDMCRVGAVEYVSFILAMIHIFLKLFKNKKEIQQWVAQI